VAIIAKESGGKDFEPLPEGGHSAICDMMVDLGLQDSHFGPKHKVYLRFQVPAERVTWEKDGESFDKPAVIGTTFTLSLSAKSNLRPFLESWRGKKFNGEDVRGFDITKVAGKPGYINIIHDEGNDGKTYANIATIMPLPHGLAPPRLEGEVLIYEEGDPNDVFDKLPEWLQKKIEGQVEEQPKEPAGAGRRPMPAAFDDDLDDDVPF
jgi:hypothetical protein